MEIAEGEFFRTDRAAWDCLRRVRWNIADIMGGIEGGYKDVDGGKKNRESDRLAGIADRRANLIIT